jgi:hypothetical protein
MYRTTGWVALALFVATIPFANWLVARYGIVTSRGCRRRRRCSRSGRP